MSAMIFGINKNYLDFVEKGIIFCHSFLMGQSRPLLVYFRLFVHTHYNFNNYKIGSQQDSNSDLQSSKLVR